MLGFSLGSFIFFRFFFQSSLPIVVMILVFLVDASSIFDMSWFGIVPRKLSGLWGVFLSPFLHASVSHLVSNLLPLWISLLVLSIFYNKSYWFVVSLCIFFSGLFTWLIGNADGVHVGASGLVFALVVFIIISGFLRRTVLLIVVGLLMAFTYQFLLSGLVPVGDLASSRISYSSHWSGVVAGVIVAFMFSHFYRNDKYKGKNLSGKDALFSKGTVSYGEGDDGGKQF